MSVVFSLRHDTDGVAIAKIKSEPSLISVSAIVGQFAVSAAAER